jgi:hypothetical protein
MGRKRKITSRRRATFLAALLETGAVTKAARASGIGRSSWYDLKERDPEFAALWDDADAEFMDDVEAEAFKRAREGETKSLPYVEVNGDDRETKFYKINTKSDRLLELCLKSRHPAYKPTKAIEFPDGPPIAPPGELPTWSNLTPDELETLVILQRKLHAARDRDVGHD